MVNSGIPSLHGSTKLMGVVGDPIAQIMTPANINPIFAGMGVNIACVPLHVTAHDLEAAWNGFKALRNLIGFGITLPHKQQAVSLCDSLDPLAERVGAVNLVRREKDGGFRGYQFDGNGFVRGLSRQGYSVAGRDCVLLGAGGAAIAIAFALAREGVASLTITNRTVAKAGHLADAVNKAIGRPVAIAGSTQPNHGQLIVNATSLGLNPDDPLPMNITAIDETMLVAEVVAKPEITSLLTAAQDRGAAIHSGIHMIRGQADLIADHLVELWGAE